MFNNRGIEPLEQRLLLSAVRFTGFDLITSDAQGSQIHQAGNLGYFIAGAGTTRGLWVTDGTPAGTRLVRDGFYTFPKENMLAVGNLMFFIAGVDTSNQNLWRSDGTTAGTYPVTNLTYNEIFGEKMAAIGNLAFFEAFETTHGRELWVSDGTVAGTHILNDLVPGPDSGYAQFPLNVGGNKIYFRANDGTHGMELFSSDGTTAGTHMVADILPGLSSSNPRPIVDLQGKLIFTAKTGGVAEPWVSDGTLTYPLSTSTLNVNYTADWVTMGNNVYFLAMDTQEHTQLYRSDGSFNGATPVFDPATGSEFIQGMAALGNRLLIIMDDVLYSTNGTPADMVRLTFNSLGVSNLVVAGDSCYFLGVNQETGKELWVTDGTAAGTHLVADVARGAISPSIDRMAPLGAKLTLWGDDYAHGFEPWISDGTSTGTQLLRDINSQTLELDTGTLIHSPDNEFPSLVVGDTFYVVGNINYSNRKGNAFERVLAATDGTSTGTRFIAATLTSIEFIQSTPSGRIYFGGNGGVWTSLGTADTTIQLTTSAASLGRVAVVGESLFFTKSTDYVGKDLWKTDGTLAGTVMVKTFPQPIYGVNGLFNFITLGNRLLFSAGDANTGTELWASNGTTAGTIPIKDIIPGPISGLGLYLFNFAVAGKLCFTAEDSALWVTDGTPDGTQPLKTLSTFYIDYPLRIGTLQWGSKVIFGYRTDNYAYTLLQTDGTSAGTLPIIDFPSAPQAFAMYQGWIYLTFKDAAGIYRNDTIYRLVPATAQVQSVITFPPYSGDTLPWLPFSTNLTATPDGVYFSLRSTSGIDLWKTDGAIAGTAIVQDVSTNQFPGPVRWFNGGAWYSHANHFWVDPPAPAPPTITFTAADASTVRIFGTFSGAGNVACTIDFSSTAPDGSNPLYLGSTTTRTDSTGHASFNARFSTTVAPGRIIQASISFNGAVSTLSSGMWLPQPGDANRDRVVDVSDLALLAAFYGTSGRTWAEGDFNGDGIADVSDLALLAAYYGQALPPLPAAPLIDPVATPATIAAATPMLQPKATTAPSPKPAQTSRPAAKPTPIKPQPVKRPVFSHAKTVAASLPRPRLARPPLAPPTPLPSKPAASSRRRENELFN